MELCECVLWACMLVRVYSHSVMCLLSSGVNGPCFVCGVLSEGLSIRLEIHSRKWPLVNNTGKLRGFDNGYDSFSL